MPRPSRRLHHTFRALGATLVLTLAAVALQPGSAAGGPPAPVEIRIDGISSLTPPLDLPPGAAPSALVVADLRFSVAVTFLDDDGFPAAFPKDTALVLATDTGDLNLPVPDISWVAPAGESSANLTTSLPEPANEVEVTVSAPGLKGKHAVEDGVSSTDQLFDVLKEVKSLTIKPNTALTVGIGGEAVDDEESCTNATPSDPVCGSVVLPKGAAGSQILLSLGLCDTAYAKCDERGSVVQLLADLNDPVTGDLYTATAPATLIIRCDKELCGGGAIRKEVLNYSLLGNGILEPAPACPAKNTLGRDPDPGADEDSPLNQEVCVDYVQSTRDGSGDTILYLLFTRDARISVS